ncbi:uncharacterized protein K444DRAFT_366552 [Hyaloscypha bicolor E]|uniref:Uncharacterized protein n=1 Tax=Hyaloscypha bicolor E TaxID=1095630 RepID=A0A2J6TE16_9HELO|nr:uncharacterized protein K444DRAFT_366552 [Hyaloscypha bicolor E]PMD61271.1 hypothetical protein K444DRAFT_366552 [Hyaloscypha bicolor E]
MFEPKFTCYREINTATDYGEAKLDPPSTSLPQINKTPSCISGAAESEKHWQRSEQEQPALPEWFRQKQPEKNCHRPLSSLVPQPPSLSWSSSYLQSARYLAILKADSETEPNDQSQEGGQPGTRKRYAGPQYIGSGERGAVGRDALAAQEDVGPGLAIRVGSCCDGGLREDTGYLGRWAVFAGFVSLLISNLEPSNSSFSCCCPPPSLPKERKGGELHRLETNKTF